MESRRLEAHGMQQRAWEPRSGTQAARTQGQKLSLRGLSEPKGRHSPSPATNNRPGTNVGASRNDTDPRIGTLWQRTAASPPPPEQGGAGGRGTRTRAGDAAPRRGDKPKAGSPRPPTAHPSEAGTSPGGGSDHRAEQRRGEARPGSAANRGPGRRSRDGSRGEAGRTKRSRRGI